MPLAWKSDIAEKRKIGTVFFFAVSLAVHAMILAVLLRYRHEPEIRFLSPEPSVSVCLVHNFEEKVDAQAKAEFGEKTVPSAPLHSLQAEAVQSPAAFPVKAKRKTVSKARQREKEGPSPEKTAVASTPKRTAEKSTETPISAGLEELPLESEHRASQMAAKEQLIGQSDAPAFSRFVPPEYPPKVRRRNIEGRVLLRVLVSADGRAREVEVVESTHPEFAKAAKRSALRSRYEPARISGLPKEVWVRIPFQFTLR